MTTGQEVFLKNGLMEYGSAFGHSAYPGPDFTADYFRRARLFPMNTTPEISEQTIADFKATRVLRGGEISSRKMRKHW